MYTYMCVYIYIYIYLYIYISPSPWLPAPVLISGKEACTFLSPRLPAPVLPLTPFVRFPWPWFACAIPDEESNYNLVFTTRCK